MKNVKKVHYKNSSFHFDLTKNMADIGILVSEWCLEGL